MAHNTYTGPYVQGINPVKTVYERGEEVSIVSFFDCFGSAKSYPHSHTLYTYYQIDGVTYGQAHAIKSYKEEMIPRLVTFKIPYNAKTVKYRTTKSGSWTSIKLKDPSPPTAPKFNSPTEYLHEASFKLEWTQSNFYTDPGHYELQKRINGGTWIDVNNNLINTYYNFDISSISRGDIVDFRVRAINNFGTSSWAVSSFKRNSIPNAVTNILPSSGFALNQVEIRWTAAKNTDNKVLKYNIYVSKNNGQYNKIATVSNCSYMLSIPSEDADGTTYSIKVETVDNLNCTNSVIGPTYIKPGEPTSPVNLGPEAGYYESYIDFTWTISNNYSVYGNYVIEIFVNEELYKTVTISGADTKYRLLLSNIDRGSDITYRIKSVDTFNRESEWLECANVFKHNNKPEKPSIILPLDTKRIHGYKPLFVLKTSTDIDEQDIILKVKIGDTIYDSVRNRDNFSKSIINSEEYVIFKPSSMLPIGTNEIAAFINDGLIDGDSCNISLEVLEQVNPFILGDFITAESLNMYIQILNTNLEAYGIDVCDIHVEKGADIKANTVNAIIHKVEELHSVINAYHLDNNLSNQIYFVPIAENSTIASHKIFNDLVNSIY